MTSLRAIGLTLAAVLTFAAPAAAAAPADLTADGAVLWDPADRRVLFGDDHRVPLRPASTTKIMTVLLALEAGTVDDVVTVSAEAAVTGRRPGAATLGLRAGQQIAMRSLLAGLVLRSGNDAAVAVAEHVAGSEAAFVELMNARAAALGMDDTTFLNSTGLTDDIDHHASARDLARLATVAMRDDDFANWAGSRTLTLPGLGTLTSRNELLGVYPGASGVKTGYTNLAGLCLVASADRDGRRLFAVVLGSDDSFADATRLLDHGFDDFRRAQPVRRGEAVLTYRWAGGTVDLTAQRRIGRTLPVDQEAVWRTVVAPDVAPPFVQGEPLGRAELVVDGEVVAKTPLVTAAAVGEPAGGPPAAQVGGAVTDALRAFARLHPVERRT